MTVITKVLGAAAVVTLDWPERRNALGPDEAAQVADALESAATQPGAAAVVLTGSGAFCAGGDLRAIIEMTKGGPEAIRSGIYGNFQRMVRAVLACPLPTIAAVDGAAVGLGMDLALACDIRLCGPSGWMRQGWAALGLVPGIGGVALFERLAPGAMWGVLADNTKLEGATLERLGLARACTTPAVDVAVAQAASLAAIGDSALRAYVDLSRPPGDVLDRHLSQALDHQVELLSSPNFARRAQQLLAR
ncbi:enoyl-CoA hydratase/isomerase family protein [Acidiferrimicrobium sp. IK]|uniref:enoyl-CoA hydratase/isomerase family protein n=1 Tax=Acidiferrimicrobium sp. IK TaxID=2871700 RepID=UPI0021CB0127|nr:enoyl-CoA hydratase/isomerase family protein [Acidiferrimicrobium sp. IK]MCU4183356.1 enoyl-CoA hydratase/isomerase family protein [Acidiferrimicrobium sp. IK]